MSIDYGQVSTNRSCHPSVVMAATVLTRTRQCLSGDVEVDLFRIEMKLRKYHKRTHGPRLLVSLIVVLALTTLAITTARRTQEVKELKAIIAAPP